MKTERVRKGLCVNVLLTPEQMERLEAVEQNMGATKGVLMKLAIDMMYYLGPHLEGIRKEIERGALKKMQKELDL